MNRHSLPIFVFLVLITWGVDGQAPALWGTTPGGGLNNSGTIFTYNVNEGTCFDKHDFSCAPDGCGPIGSLLKASNGLIYGLAAQGGKNNVPSEGGVLFSYDYINNIYTDLHDFGTSPDGSQPYGTLIQAGNGLLYGMTLGGGNTSGVVFSYDINSGIYTILNPQGGTGGYELNGALLQASDSLLYGTATEGGAHDKGTLFSYNISTNTFNILHNFGASTDGAYPVGSLLQASNGLLYGNTGGGGTNRISFGGGGTIYSYNISTGAYATLHSFGNGTDGWRPSGALIQEHNGLLFGLTEAGGNVNQEITNGGTIFTYDITAGAETVVYSFAEPDEGVLPSGTLLQASNNLLYGLTAEGGNVDGAAIGAGLVFSFNPLTSVFTPLHDLAYITEGANPNGSLIELSSDTSHPELEITKFGIFPNPSNGQFTIQIPGTINDYLVVVYDMLGQIIYQAFLTNSKNTINLPNTATGIYNVYLQTGVSVRTVRIMVTR